MKINELDASGRPWSADSSHAGWHSLCDGYSGTSSNSRSRHCSDAVRGEIRHCKRASIHQGASPSLVPFQFATLPTVGLSGMQLRLFRAPETVEITTASPNIVAVSLRDSSVRYRTAICDLWAAASFFSFLVWLLLGRVM